MSRISRPISLKDADITLTFIRASGPGGQNVNKVATAVQLRFNVYTSTLPEEVRERLVLQIGKQLTTEGDYLIKAGRYRTQERNKQDALKRLYALIARAAICPKKRKKTKPTLASKQRRLNSKTLRGKTKALRQEKL